MLLKDFFQIPDSYLNHIGGFLIGESINGSDLEFKGEESELEIFFNNLQDKEINFLGDILNLTQKEVKNIFISNSNLTDEDVDNLLDVVKNFIDTQMKFYKEYSLQDFNPFVKGVLANKNIHNKFDIIKLEEGKELFERLKNLSDNQ